MKQPFIVISLQSVSPTENGFLVLAAAKMRHFRPFYRHFKPKIGTYCSNGHLSQNLPEHEKFDDCTTS
jgi:hypothetical protein